MTHNRTGQYFFRRPLRAVIHLVSDFQSLSMLKPTKGDGYTVNLSMKGCCIDSDVPVEVGMRLSLCMELSDQTSLTAPHPGGSSPLGGCQHLRPRIHQNG